MTPAGNNDYNEPQYSFNIPTDVDGIVFNNGNGEQTADAYYISPVGIRLTPKTTKATMRSVTGRTAAVVPAPTASISLATLTERTIGVLTIRS